MANDPSTVGYQILLFLSLIGIALQIFNVIPSFFNFVEFNEVPSNYGIPSFITIPIIRDFILSVVGVLSMYYGAKIFGIVTGQIQSIGSDFPILFRLIALAIVYGAIVRLPSLISLLLTLGPIGYTLAMFLGILAFYSGWSILFSYSR